MISASPTNVPSEVQIKLKRQLDVWRRELIAMDRRQRLLYFKHTKSASLEIVDPAPSAVLAIAEDGDARFVADEDGATTGRREFAVSDKNIAELRASLRRLDQRSNQMFADRGVWTLYLGLGTLEWRDPQDDKLVASPVVLAPVRLRRDATDSPYLLSRTDDDVVVNPVLALKLEHDFGIELPLLDPDELDLDDYLASVQVLAASRSGWTVQ